MWISVAIIVGLVVIFGFFTWLGRRGDGGGTGPDDKRNQIAPRHNSGLGTLTR